MNVNTVVCRSQSFSTSNEEINANFISLAVLIVLLSYILCYKCTISLDLHFQNHIAVLYKYQLNGGAGKKFALQYMSWVNILVLSPVDNLGVDPNYIFDFQGTVVRKGYSICVLKGSIVRMDK